MEHHLPSATPLGIVVLIGIGKHMAELTSAGKNAISHRGKALEKAKEMLGKGIVTSGE